ncbi:MAG TPA: DUF3601 domain-containing protein [Chitinophagaceae bacterium]|nr:DUF3601 domain-containing protein [Chitinophagaceae bacterium]
MSNPLKLTTGKQYRVVQPFTDYDGIVHAAGETWIFDKTNFLPYDDGLTLHVLSAKENKPAVYRLQWRKEEQGYIIEHFAEFVEPV